MKNDLTGVLVILLLVPILACSQEQTTESRFEIEVDPIAFMLNGYSFHLGYNLGHFRLDGGVFGLRQPGFAVANPDFNVFSKGVGVKADYLINKHKGIFMGFQSDYIIDRIGLLSGGEEQSDGGPTLGLRGGYRFMLGKEERQYRGFYIVPWVALIYATRPSTVILGQQIYRQQPLSVFPTVHLGYRF